jgi:hypothetical protein
MLTHFTGFHFTMTFASKWRTCVQPLLCPPMVHVVVMLAGNLLIKEITTEIGAFAFCRPLTAC